MKIIKTTELPAKLEASTIYFVKNASGLSVFITDETKNKKPDFFA